MKRKRPSRESVQPVESEQALEDTDIFDGPNSLPANVDSFTKRKDHLKRVQQNYESDFSDGGKNVVQDQRSDSHIDQASENDFDEENRDDTDALNNEVNGKLPGRQRSKPQRGRPKGYRKPRTPSPPRHFPSYHHFFFQNRPKGVVSSNNTTSSLALTSHEDYFNLLHGKTDQHAQEREFLQSLHSRSFDQWTFELSHGFNICLHGWGSKRAILNAFARFITAKSLATQIVVINGYNTALGPRDILETVALTIPAIAGSKLANSPSDSTTALLAALFSSPPEKPILLIVNSIDGSSLRRAPMQSLLSHLSSSPHIQLIASADSPHSPLIWSRGLLAKFNWVFHDATTFQPYDVEIGAGGRSSVVDEVNHLIGRSNRKLQGKEGVMYVLRSLTVNARNLYSLLLGELLAMTTNEMEEDADIPLRANDGGGAHTSLVNDVLTLPNNAEAPEPLNTGKQALHSPKATISSHTLYSRAVSQLITTNDVNFRALLKEFYDHEMITSQRDGLGAEVLGVPFRKEEMELILADLIDEV